MPEISVKAGCACDTTPAVEICVRKLCDTAAMDSTPPRDMDVGFGNGPCVNAPVVEL